MELTLGDLFPVLGWVCSVSCLRLGLKGKIDITVEIKEQRADGRVRSHWVPLHGDQKIQDSNINSSQIISP